MGVLFKKAGWLLRETGATSVPTRVGPLAPYPFRVFPSEFCSASRDRICHAEEAVCTFGPQPR